ncbi:MAG: hypothetical protein D6790_06390 [Caldilineae bacterium]|nr:MAG: hypothetical protein D6790_06390 [Caldilineae bacterium]
MEGNSTMELTDQLINAKAELLFPAHLIPILRDLRGEEWQQLVDRVAALPDTHPDSLAFVLMMVRLGDCMKCHSNYYKFLRGCALCSIQTIQSFKGTDADLLRLYRKAQDEIEQYIGAGNLSLAA